MSSMCLPSHYDTRDTFIDDGLYIARHDSEHLRGPAESGYKSCYSQQTPSASSESDAMMPELLFELFSNIASFVTPSDLPNFRLGNVALAKAGAIPLFREVVVTWTPKCLKSIIEISRHPKLAQIVSTLHFDECVMNPEYLEYDRWRLEMTHRRQFKFYLPNDILAMPMDCDRMRSEVHQWSKLPTGPSVNMREDRLKLDRGALTIAIKEQYELLKSKKELPMLVASLSMFPNCLNVTTFDIPFDWDFWFYNPNPYAPGYVAGEWSLDLQFHCTNSQDIEFTFLEMWANVARCK